MGEAGGERPAKSWRRRWGVRLVLLGLAALAVFAPMLVSRTPLRHWAARWVLGGLDGQVEIGETDLGWHRPLLLSDVRVTDGEGRTLLTAAQVEGSKRLAGFLWDRHDLGEFVVRGAVLEIVGRGDTTNLEQALAPVVRKLRAVTPGGQPAGKSFRLRLEEATVRVLDEDTGRRWELPGVNVDVSVPRDGQEALRATAKGQVTKVQPPGSFELDLTLPRGAAAPGKDGAASGRRTVFKLEGIPLGLFDPLLRRWVAGLRLDGRISGELAGVWSAADEGEIAGTLRGQDVQVRAAFLGPDRLQPRQCDLPLRVKVHGPEVRVEQAALVTDLGRVDFQGTGEPARGLAGWLRAGQTLGMDVDVARVAAQAPVALRLHKDVRPQAGRLVASLKSTAQGQDVVWQGDVRASDLRAERAGQVVAWPEPVVVQVTARQKAGPAGEGWPALVRLRCESDFLKAEGAPAGESTVVTGTCDLGMLADRLARFVEVGPVRPSGQGGFRVTVTRGKDEAFQVKGEGQVRQLVLAWGAGPPVRHEQVNLRMDLAGKTAGDALRLDSGRALVDAAEDRLDVALAGPVADVLAGTWPGLVVQARGRVERWQAWLGQTGSLGGRFAATVTVRPVDSRLDVSGEATVEELTVGPRDKPWWKEPRVRLSGRGAYDPGKDQVRLDRAEVNAQAVQATLAGGVQDVRGAGILSLEGKLAYDLEKLGPQLRPYLGAGTQLVGKDTRPVRLEGPLFAPAGAVRVVSLAGGPAATVPGWTGSGSLHWDQARAAGCRVGAAELKVKQEDGWLKLAPVEAVFNEGKLRLNARMRTEPGPWELHLERGVLIERARLTPEACADALGYLLPALAQVTEVQGEFSVLIDEGRVPVGNPAGAVIKGKVVLHDAVVGGAPLIQEIAGALSVPAKTTVAREVVVPFEVRDGRVYHKDLELRFGDVAVRTSGWAGFDGRLALAAEMPFSPKWFAGAPRAANVLGKQVVRVPIGGTLGRPQLDRVALRAEVARLGREIGGGFLLQEIDNGLKKLLPPR